MCKKSYALIGRHLGMALIMAMGVLLSAPPAHATDVQPQDTPSENVAVASNAMLFLSQHPRLETIRIWHLKADEMPTIETYSVNVVVAGKYAHITTELTVRGHDKKRFSGDLVLPLPHGAFLTGYSILVNHDSIHNQMVDAISVPRDDIDRMRAENTTYIDEMAPIPTSGYVDHEFRIALSQVTTKSLTPVRVNYMIPLDDNGAGSDLYIPLPDAKLKERNIHITVDGQRVDQPKSIDGTHFEKVNDTWMWNEFVRNAAPEKPLHYIIPAVADEVSVVHRSPTLSDKSHFVIHVKDKDNVPTVPHDLSKMRIIWDDSRMLDEESVRAARRVIELIPEKGNYEIITFSGGVNAAQQFTTRGDLLQYIDSLHYDGQMLLDDIMPSFKAPYSGMKLVFTNGMFWMNDEYLEPMNDIAVIVSGKLPKTEILRNAGVRLYDLNENSAEAVVQNLKAMGSSGVSVTGQHISELQIAGDYIKGELTILGELSAITDEVTVSFNNKTHVFQLSSASAPTSRTLESAWAFAKMRALFNIVKAKSYNNVVRLSKQFALPSPYTKLVVLDQLEQYSVFSIIPPDYLTEMHQEYCKNNSHCSKPKPEWENEPIKNINELLNEFIKNNIENVQFLSVEDYLELWKYKKPKNVYDEYICHKSSTKDCTSQDYTEVAHWSEYGIHYIEPFTAPKNWTCTSKMHCGGVTLPERTPYDTSSHGLHSSKYVSVYRGTSIKIIKLDRSIMVSSYPEQWMHPSEEFNIKADFTRKLVERAPYEEENINDEEEDMDALKINDTAYEMPYLDDYRNILKNNGDWNAVYAEYLRYSKQYPHNVAFYFESADFFARHQQITLASRILSNLMLYESSHYDEELIEKHIVRLIDYGDLDRAIHLILNRVTNDPSDLIEHLIYTYAIALEKRARRDMRLSDALNALNALKAYYYYIIDNPHYSDYANLVLDEYNNLKAWIQRQRWNEKIPKIADCSSQYTEAFDADLRIVMRGPSYSWADFPMLGIKEPSSEVVTPFHQYSLSGGVLMSDDYESQPGFNVYVLKTAPAGEYTIYVYEDRNSVISNAFSNVLLSVTVYRNWGRPNQSEETLLLRVNETAVTLFPYYRTAANMPRFYKIGSITIK